MKSKNIFKNYLYLPLIVILGVVNPLYNIAGASSHNPSFSVSAEANLGKSIQVVEVVNVVPNYSIASVVNPTMASGVSNCTSTKFVGGGSVQDQLLVNLNQPASCFRLITGMLSPTQKISVSTVIPIKPIVVVVRWPVQTIASYKLKPAPIQQAPLIPTQSFFFIAVVFVGFGIKKLIQKINLKTSLISSTNYGLLMIMRC